MSRDIDNIIKRINDTNKELHNLDKKTEKDFDQITKDISFLKKEMRIISDKIDQALDILTSFTLLSEEELEDDDEYDGNEGWIADVEWFSEEDDEDDEDLENG